MQSFDMGRVPPVSFGAGRLEDVAGIAAGLAGGPVLVIADAVLADLGVTRRLADSLAKAGLGCEMAAEIAGEPKEAHVDALSARARETGVATVVGIGGGAAMDAAKLVAAIAPSGQPASRYALCAEPLPGNGLPAIAVPTTAGTGSEVTRTSIVSTGDGTKNWFWGEELMFAHAVLDPALTVSLPPRITAWTGIDAVAHALEAVTARSASAAGRLYGLEALRLLSRALPEAVAQGADLQARSQVLWASTLAGLALHNCNTHMGHNISHALGSLARVHHGLATGLALEISLPWLVARPDGAENYAAVAEALGGAARAADLPGVFAGLMRQIGIPAQRPASCGAVTAAELAEAMKSAANWSMSQNAACAIGSEDLDDIARMFVGLPVEPAAN